MAHKQLYPSYRFHQDGRERIVHTPAEDAALTAEDAQWINRPPHGVAHDRAWAAAQSPALSPEPDTADLDAETDDASETTDETSAEKTPKAAKRKKKVVPVDKP